MEGDSLKYFVRTPVITALSAAEENNKKQNAESIIYGQKAGTALKFHQIGG